MMSVNFTELKLGGGGSEIRHEPWVGGGPENRISDFVPPEGPY